MIQRIKLCCFAFFVLAALGSCSNSDFSADIELKGLGNQRVHVIYCNSDGNVVDTWMIAEKDHLIIDGDCGSPSLLFLFNSMNVPITRIVVTGGDKIKVTGKIVDSYNLKVEGSELLEKWNDFIVKHKTAYQTKNPAILNPEIEKYVKSNRTSVVSTLLVLFDYVPSTPERVDKLLDMIDEGAKPSSLIDSYNTIKGRIIKPATRITSLNLYEMTSEDFETARISGSKPSILFFWDKELDKTKRNTIIEELKTFNAEAVNIVDINIDSDSVSWYNTIAADNTSWKHYWVPGSMMNAEVIRLQITSTPTIIVTDSLGNQKYRGNDELKARQTIESLAPAAI